MISSKLSTKSCGVLGSTKLRAFCLLILALMVLPLLAPNAYADPILGADLSQFAILGGGGVTIGSTGNVIFGSIGAYPTTSITGVIPTNFTISGGTVQPGGATAIAAQSQLGTAITGLDGMTVTGGSVSSLGTQTLGPGVYSAASGLTLTGGTITLDGGGNANALWVFQVSSLLTVQSSTVINVINSGAGAGVYWVVGNGSATLDPNVTFAGNILTNESITLAGNDTDPCGRLATQVASVALNGGTDKIGIGCSGALTGSNGLSGGGTITIGLGGTPVVTTAPFQSVPEPGTLVLLAFGIAGLLGMAWMKRARRASPALA